MSVVFRQVYSRSLLDRMKRWGGPILAEAVREHPAGHGAEERVEAWWYTYRRTKVVRCVVWSTPLPTVPAAHVDVGPDAKAEAFRVVFPERWERLQIAKNLRTLRRLGAVLPQSPIIRVKEVNERLRMGLVLAEGAEEEETENYLCTPAGCFSIRWWMAGTLASAVLDVTGESLWRKVWASWEDVEPLFVAAALAK